MTQLLIVPNDHATFISTKFSINITMKSCAKYNCIFTLRSPDDLFPLAIYLNLLTKMNVWYHTHTHTHIHKIQSYNNSWFFRRGFEKIFTLQSMDDLFITPRASEPIDKIIHNHFWISIVGSSNDFKNIYHCSLLKNLGPLPLRSIDSEIFIWVFINLHITNMIYAIHIMPLLVL